MSQNGKNHVILDIYNKDLDLSHDLTRGGAEMCKMNTIDIEIEGIQRRAVEVVGIFSDELIGITAANFGIKILWNAKVINE